MGLLAAWKQSSTLRSISKALSGRSPWQQREAALEDLLDFVQGQDWAQEICIGYNLSRENLREIFNDMVRGGCGQWVRGHYVPASALATPQTLIYLCEAKQRNVPRGERFSQLIDYFEKGKMNAPALPSAAHASDESQGVLLADTQQTLKSIRELPAPVRQKCAQAVGLEITSAMREIENAPVPSDELDEIIKRHLTRAKEFRHSALHRGAKSDSDPAWAAAALYESWMFAVTGTLNARESEEMRDLIKDWLEEEMNR